jgi:alkanesulfonate monooxygenase SsuD/methylene tetrahydromethanopterin reductase-like flavin-dependent oxidoreductase (luciferase family)
MADYIRALRAIFHAFQTGDPLNYVGTHYTFNKLQAYFNPGPLDHPAPAIWTGGVNARMVAMAGELADGFVCHPTNSHPEILRTQTLPALAGGSPRVIANPQPLMAATHQEIGALRDSRRGELAFLYGTPAYRRQLERIGVTDLGALEQLVPQGTYDEIPELLGQWYSRLCDGLTIALPAGDDDALAELVRRCRRIPTRGDA